jgi:hypothetical protein
LDTDSRCSGREKVVAVETSGGGGRGRCRWWRFNAGGGDGGAVSKLGF